MATARLPQGSVREDTGIRVARNNYSLRIHYRKVDETTTQHSTNVESYTLKGIRSISSILDAILRTRLVHARYVTSLPSRSTSVDSNLNGSQL